MLTLSISRLNFYWHFTIKIKPQVLPLYHTVATNQNEKQMLPRKTIFPGINWKPQDQKQ